MYFKRAHRVKTQQNIDLMTPTFFGRSFPFLILSFKQKNLYVGSFNYFSYTIHIGSNWYMETGVRDLEVESFKANST